MSVNRDKLSFRLAVAMIALYFIQNFYFGWNITPQSKLEAIADSVGFMGLILAFFIRPVRQEYQTINPETMIVRDSEIVMTDKAVKSILKKKS